MCSAQLQESRFCSRLMGSYGAVWIGPDGSAMGGRTMGSSWTDHEISRVITSRSCAHKSSDWRVLAEFSQGPALEPAQLRSVPRRKLTSGHTL
jgi:hypothetical protein